ncbi:hypothetical protein PLICRDRAFT_84390, partial [Plicaturopsis crispa FD-325 SS-3]
VLIDAGLPLSLWSAAANYIIFTKNHNPTAALKSVSPYEFRFHEKLDISCMHCFGC